MLKIDSLRGFDDGGVPKLDFSRDDRDEPSVVGAVSVLSDLSSFGDGKPDFRRPLLGESSSKRSSSKPLVGGDRGGKNSPSLSRVAKLIIPSASFHNSTDWPCIIPWILA